MAAFDTPRSTAFGDIGLIGRTRTLLTAAVSNFLVWNDLRQTRKALSNLSDRELADIGLSRCDLPKISAVRPCA